MRTPANTMAPVNLDIQTKITAVFVFLDSTVKTVKEVGVWGWSNYSYLSTVTVSQRLQTNNTKTSLLAYGGVKTRLQSEPWENWPSEYWKQPLLKADTHEGFCSQSMLQGLTLREQSSSVSTNDFMGILHLREQNFHPAKCSTIFNRLNIWEQAPGANWANLKTLPRVYWQVQNKPGAWKQTIGKLHYLRVAEWKPVCSRCREKIDPRSTVNSHGRIHFLGGLVPEGAYKIRFAITGYCGLVFKTPQ